MKDNLKHQLEKCVESLADYEKNVTNDPKGWLYWSTCVTHFQKNEYSKAMEVAAGLLAGHCLSKWFIVLQVLLISLRHSENRADIEDWSKRLVKAVPLTPWQFSLTQIVLNNTDSKSVLAKAKDLEQTCQAHYYIGENFLCAGDTQKALESFQKSSVIQAKCVENAFAKNRIESMAKSKKDEAPENSISFVKSYYTPMAPTKNQVERWLRQGSGEELLEAVSKLLKGVSPQEIAPFVDEQRKDSWSRLTEKLADAHITPESVPRDSDSQWLPREARYVVADIYKEVFLERIKSANLIQDAPALGSLKMIKGSDLKRFKQLPEYRNIKNLLKSLNSLPQGSKKFFISHRWLSPNQPDPNGVQMSLLRENIQPDSYYWIDYSCLPQKPRTTEEETLFRESLKWLPTLFFGIDVIVLRCHDDGYFNRAWCFFELFAAHVLGKKIEYILEKKALDNFVAERQVLEKTLLNMDLPDNLGTAEPMYLESIRLNVQNVAFFFKLRVVEHYMILGQEISSGHLFFLEDPYYFMAVCDFSEVMLWMFDKAKTVGMQLNDLSADYIGQNFFMKIAEKEKFQNITGDYALHKKVCLDEARLLWFYDNRFSGDSATNLFYKISSMIS
jgi:hypothetical protein